MKILCVDDDANILAGFQRQLRREFTMDTALGGAEALETIACRGPYAVVVSDMRMPGMDGIHFLTRVRETAPETVRMMLTGNADQQTAVDAVNEGHIFRFLTKPCPPETLAKALRAGIDQHRLITAEKELLEKTLNGSVKVLTEILSLINPIAFSRASRIQSIVRHIARELQWKDIWQLELAAMLSQIGCITVMPDVLEAVHAGEELSDTDRQRYEQHPAVASRLLANIPRLETIAQMIGRQFEPCSPGEMAARWRPQDPVFVGAQVLKVAAEFERMLGHVKGPRAAVAHLAAHPEKWPPQIVTALQNIELPATECELRVVELHELRTRMILDEHVRASNGLLLVTKGQEVTFALLERLRNFAANGAIPSRLRVLVP
jgi:CheY-like chemotaxis protein